MSFVGHDSSDLLPARCDLFMLPQPSRRLENLALRHQVAVLQHAGPRPRLGQADRWLCVVLCRVWEKMAQFPPHRQAGDRPRLASDGLQEVQGMEEPGSTARKKGGGPRNPKADPDDESIESALERTTNLRLTPETGSRYM
jgi:hypothetical protein